MGSDENVALAAVLAFMATGFLLLARLAGLGFLADFLSRTVLVTFLTGVGVQEALGQVAQMQGLAGSGGNDAFCETLARSTPTANRLER